MVLTATENDLIASFASFLRQKLSSGSLTESQAESVEVALQCLESAFSCCPEQEASLPSLVDLLDQWRVSHSEPDPEKDARAELLKEQGNDLMKNEKFDDALAKYTEALAVKKSPVYYCNRAAAYTKLDRFDEAIEDCKKALQLDPKHSKAYGRMGLVYSCLDKHREAVECYKKALELDPANSSYRNNLSIAENKLAGAAAGGAAGNAGPGAGNPFAGLAGLAGGGMPDMAGFLNNPAMVNMASQIMSDPNMQNFMSSIMSNTTNRPGGTDNIQALLEAGQRLAAQMQQQNPDLVEHLRRQFQGGPDGGAPPGPGGN